MTTDKPPYPLFGRDLSTADSHVYRPTLGWVCGLLVAVVFIGGMALMAVRDHRAESRCHRLGGQTYDSGQHCTVGGRTVSTR